MNIQNQNVDHRNDASQAVPSRNNAFNSSSRAIQNNSVKIPRRPIQVANGNNSSNAKTCARITSRRNTIAALPNAVESQNTTRQSFRWRTPVQRFLFQNKKCIICGKMFVTTENKTVCDRNCRV